MGKPLLGKLLLFVSTAGAIGGLMNALLSGTGVILPHFAVVDGSQVLTPGFVGNVLAGAVAALVSFGLYGPFSSTAILTTAQPEGTASPAQLTLAALAGAALVGYSGSRWITAEADKQFSHGTAVATAQIAEHFEESAESSTAPRALPRPPGVGRSQLQSLTRSVQTLPPWQAYQEAVKLKGALDK